MIRRFVAGTCSDEDWDEFVCVPIKDPDLDDIRKRVIDLDDLYTGADNDRLLQLASEVESLKS